MTPKHEVPDAVKSSIHLLNMALRDAQRQGFDCEISERARRFGGEEVVLLDVVVRERPQSYGSSISGVHSGFPG